MGQQFVWLGSKGFCVAPGSGKGICRTRHFHIINRIHRSSLTFYIQVIPLPLKILGLVSAKGRVPCVSKSVWTLLALGRGPPSTVQWKWPWRLLFPNLVLVSVASVISDFVTTSSGSHSPGAVPTEPWPGWTGQHCCGLGLHWFDHCIWDSWAWSLLCCLRTHCLCPWCLLWAVSK